jgi:hypothetical protein
MGCCSSTQVYPGAALEERIQAALREIIVYKDKHREDTQATFTRIILKFPVLRVRMPASSICASIRSVLNVSYEQFLALLAACTSPPLSSPLPSLRSQKLIPLSPCRLPLLRFEMYLNILTLMAAAVLTRLSCGSVWRLWALT